jgi:hypothetical protein
MARSGKNTMMHAAILVLLTLMSSAAYAQNNSGIGTTVPTASALLEVYGTTQGLLTPRLTNAQRNAITAPATGLLIFQTNSTPTESSQFYYYDGWRWIPWGMNADLWWITGNTATTAGTNFLGTVDSMALVQKTNSQERLRFYAPGDIAIISGTTAQELRFHEPSGSGSNYTSVEARAQALNIPWILPDTQGAARTVLLNNGSGTLFWGNMGATMIMAASTLATISANQNNLDLPQGSTLFRVCATANYDITGFAGGVDGRFVIVCNVCGGNLRLIDSSPLSAVGNRILMGGGGAFSLAQDQASLFVYDGVSQVWRLVGKTP